MAAVHRHLHMLQWYVMSMSLVLSVQFKGRLYVTSMKDKKLQYAVHGARAGAKKPTTLCPDVEKKKIERTSVWTLAYFEWRAASAGLKLPRLPRDHHLLPSFPLAHVVLLVSSAHVWSRSLSF